MLIDFQKKNSNAQQNFDTIETLDAFTYISTVRSNKVRFDRGYWLVRLYCTCALCRLVKCILSELIGGKHVRRGKIPTHSEHAGSKIGSRIMTRWISPFMSLLSARFRSKVVHDLFRVQELCISPRNEDNRAKQTGKDVETKAFFFYVFQTSHSVQRLWYQGFLCYRSHGYIISILTFGWLPGL